MDQRGRPAGVGLRLYQATADAHWILAKDGRPDYAFPCRSPDIAPKRGQ